MNSDVILFFPMGKSSRGLFITGTDTEVGKTYVTALIARQLRAEGHTVGVYKPVASGCRLDGGQLVSDDAVALWEAAGRPGNLDRVCPQRFAAPLAPHLAAKREGLAVDSKLLRSGYDYWRECSDIVLVEGAGGLLSPLSDEDYAADLALDLELPLAVVARNALGTINHALQTIVAAGAVGEGLQVLALVLNDAAAPDDDMSRKSNYAELAQRIEGPQLARVAWRGDEIVPRIDWFSLVGS